MIFLVVWMIPVLLFWLWMEFSGWLFEIEPGSTRFERVLQFLSLVWFLLGLWVVSIGD